MNNSKESPREAMGLPESTAKVMGQWLAPQQASPVGAEPEGRWSHAGETTQGRELSCVLPSYPTSQPLSKPVDTGVWES